MNDISFMCVLTLKQITGHTLDNYIFDLMAALDEKFNDHQSTLNNFTAIHPILAGDRGNIYLKGSASLSSVLLSGTIATSQFDWLSCWVYP